MYYAIHKKTKRHRIVDHDTPVSKNEDIVLADADGWIEWHGGECPLPDGDLCGVRLKSGKEHEGFMSRSFDWNTKQMPVIAYRPILEEAKHTQWRGPEDGLPPIGCTVGVTFPGMAQDRFEVLAHNKEKAVVFCRKTEMAMSLSANDLKPLRTPEEIAEERAVEAIGRAARECEWVLDNKVLHHIYATIRDGRIPGVKLESQ